MNPAPCVAAPMTVAAYWCECYPHLAPQAKRRVINAYARFLAGMAEARPHGTLPLPSDCVVAGAPAMADFSCPGHPAQALAGTPLLAPLLAWFWLNSTRSERFRFLAAFGGPARTLRCWDLAAIEKAAWRRLEQSWSSRLSAVRRGGQGYLVERQSGFTIWRCAEAAVEAALDDLLPDPDQAYRDARVCKPGSRNHTARVRLAGQAYLLKRYNCRSLTYRLRNALRPSRALKNWILIHHFLVRGISVPRPGLCLEKRSCRLLGNSYILMEFCAGQTLRQVWPKLRSRECEALLAALAIQLGRMHRFGLLHGDLKWDNILIQRETGRFRVILIDFDGSRRVRQPARTLAGKDLRRFLRDLRSNDPSGGWETRFMRTWSALLSSL